MRQATPFAGKNWYYPFREINITFNEKRFKKRIVSISGQYSKITDFWNTEKNSEWTCRFFIAAKLIAVATSHINAWKIVESHGLHITASSLKYYATLSLLRAVCCTLPNHKWDKGKILQTSHEDASKWTVEYLQKFDAKLSKSIEKIIEELEHRNEFVSYEANSLEKVSADNDNFLSVCRLLAEIAQFNSELLEESLFERNFYDKSEFTLLPKYLDEITFSKNDVHASGNIQSQQQLRLIAKQYPEPKNLMGLMTKGYIDNYFAWWFQKDDFNDHVLHKMDPKRQIIFNIPH
ncbi:MAG: hypothetical protein WCJ11_04905 [Methylococcaceae bacterium]